MSKNDVEDCKCESCGRPTQTKCNTCGEVYEGSLKVHLALPFHKKMKALIKAIKLLSTTDKFNLFDQYIKPEVKAEAKQEVKKQSSKPEVKKELKTVVKKTSCIKEKESK